MDVWYIDQIKCALELKNAKVRQCNTCALCGRLLHEGGVLMGHKSGKHGICDCFEAICAACDATLAERVEVRPTI